MSWAVRSVVSMGGASAAPPCLTSGGSPNVPLVVGRTYTRPMFTPVRTRRTFEEAAEQIADKVRAGELRVGRQAARRARPRAADGDQPPDAARGGARCSSTPGCSRSAAGPGGGMFVATDVVPVDLVRQRRPSCASARSPSVLEARRLIEPRVARLAARARDGRATSRRWSARSRRCARSSTRGYRPEDEDRFLQLDVQFHLALARAAGNPTVETLMRIALPPARDRARHGDARPAVPEWTIDIHERTLAAVAVGRPDDVDEVMDEHLGQLEETLRRPDRRCRKFFTPSRCLVRCPDPYGSGGLTKEEGDRGDDGRTTTTTSTHRRARAARTRARQAQPPRDHARRTSTCSSRARSSSPASRRSCACCSTSTAPTRRAGLNTATFVSGYQGSPLGGFDKELMRLGELGAEHGIALHPGPQRGARRDRRLRLAARRRTCRRRRTTA